MNKKLIVGLIAGFIAAPSFAAAPDLCKGDGKDAAVEAAGKFIATAFKQKCSNNVFSEYGESNSGAWVVAASKKGKNYFMGHTNGGAAIPVPGADEIKASADPSPGTYLTKAEALGGS